LFELQPLKTEKDSLTSKSILKFAQFSLYVLGTATIIEALRGKKRKATASMNLLLKGKRTSYIYIF